MLEYAAFKPGLWKSRRYLNAFLLLCLSLVSCNLFAQGAPFGCTADFYQTRQGTGTNSGTALLQFPPAVLISGGTATNVYGSVLATGINAASLRPSDGYIYGLDTSAGAARLHRLGTTGSVLVGTIVTTGAQTPALPVSFTPTAGAFDALGRFYFAGQTGTNISPSAIYRVDDFVTDVSATAGVQLGVAQVYALSATTVNVGDIAFGSDGNLYGATGTTLVQFALAGATATVSTRTIANVGSIGSAFFNNAGQFFVYDNGAAQLRQVNFSLGALFPSGGVTVGAPVSIAGSAPVPSATASSDGISCITYQPAPTLTLTKVSTGGVGTFSYTGNNGFTNQNIVTVTPGTGVTATTQTLTLPSVATSVTETPATGFILLGAVCTGIGAGTATLVGNTLNLNAAATATGNNIACTFTNGVQADLVITKTDNVAAVTAGGSAIFTIRVTNNGPGAVTGAIISDPLVAGLNKTAVACSATPGACVSPPTVAQLQAGTFALPVLAAGAFYEITVTATVTATGF